MRVTSLQGRLLLFKEVYSCNYGIKCIHYCVGATV